MSMFVCSSCKAGTHDRCLLNCECGQLDHKMLACRYCGEMTGAVGTLRCIDCHELEKVIKINPGRALRILLCVDRNVALAVTTIQDLAALKTVDAHILSALSISLTKMATLAPPKP